MSLPDRRCRDVPVAVERRRGRPSRVAGEIASERIWAWVTPSERRALEAFALNTHQEIATVLREAINVFVADSSEDLIFRHR